MKTAPAGFDQARFDELLGQSKAAASEYAASFVWECRVPGCGWSGALEECNRNPMGQAKCPHCGTDVVRALP